MFEVLVYIILGLAEAMGACGFYPAKTMKNAYCKTG